MNTHGVIDVGGKQYIVQKGDTITIEKQQAEEGSKISFPIHMLFDEKSEALGRRRVQARSVPLRDVRPPNAIVPQPRQHRVCFGNPPFNGSF